MKFKNVYFVNGTAYAGKSTMVHVILRDDKRTPEETLAIVERYFKLC